MKARFWVPAAVIVALAAAALYLATTGGRTPAAQPPLARFDQADFDHKFRAAAGEGRLLVLLSPT